MIKTKSPGIRYPIETPPEFGVPVEVAPDIFWVRLPLPMALDHVNCFVCDDGDGLTIVDTGFDTKKTRQLWQRVLDRHFAGKPVRRALVTHHHPDHVGLAGWFQKDFGAELVTTRTSWLMARMLTLDVHPEPTEETLQFWVSAGMDADVLAARKVERPFNFADVVAPMPLGYRRIKEGDAIKLAGRNWVVRIGNGHAPEHATLWCEDDALVLGGDQLLASISSNLGVYATEPDADPVADWLESCERLKPFANQDHFVLPGHKLPYSGLEFRINQLIDNHVGALDRLLDHLEEPKTAGECFIPLFKRQIRGGEYGLALVEAMAHVNHLYLAGLADRERRDDGAWLFCRKA